MIVYLIAGGIVLFLLAAVLGALLAGAALGAAGDARADQLYRLLANAESERDAALERLRKVRQAPSAYVSGEGA